MATTQITPLTVNGILLHPSAVNVGDVLGFLRQHLEDKVVWDQSKYIWLLREVMGLRCQRYFEIGVHGGSSLAAAAYCASPVHMLAGIDTFKGSGKHGTRTRARTFSDLMDLNVHDHNIAVVTGDAGDTSTAAKLIPRFAPCDMLYVDADKSQGFVAKIWSMYSPHISLGGLAMFNDYAIYKGDGVRKFFDRLGVPSDFHCVGVVGRMIIFQRVQDA